VFAHGESFVQPGFPDVVFCYLRFATGITAHLHLSRVDAQTARRVSAVGSARMAVLDDARLVRTLTVFNKGAAARHSRTLEESELVQLGDIVTPRLSADEPLRLECNHFLAGVRSAAESGSAREAARVVRVIEALERSLERHGAPDLVSPPREHHPPQVLSLPRRH
jgi:predicted dehydrogenase